MQRPHISKPWVWIVLIFLFLALSAVSFLKREKYVSLALNLELPAASSSPEDPDPCYLDEVVDPESTYAMAHVASITELSDGTLAATWYAGSAELAGDVNIYFATKTKSSLRWSEPSVIMSRGQAAKDLGIYVKGLGNALIFAREDGILHLIYSTIVIGKWSGSSLNMTSSQDGGHTWEKSRSLFLSPCFNLSELVKNAPIPLVGRGWVIPVYQEFLGKFPELLWLSPDEDCSWIVTKSRIAGGCSLFQPTLTAFTGNKVMAFFRDYYTSQKVWSSQSDDACRTWSLPKPTSLPNHDSGVASLRLLNGSLLLAFNDSSNSRDTLRLAISNDEGENWTTIATIIKEPNGDFCYPYFFRSRDGFIHLLYTWQRRHIHHVLFNEAWVRQQHTLDTPSTISITTSTP